MDKPIIRLLHIEDTTTEAIMVKQLLSRSKQFQFEIEWAPLLMEGLKRLADETFDVVLSDLQLPDGYGLSTFQLVQDQAYDVPIVILTNIDDDLVGIKAIQAGAQDYLIKSQIDSNRLVRTLCFAIERHRILSELRSRYEERIGELEKKHGR